MNPGDLVQFKVCGGVYKKNIGIVIQRVLIYVQYLDVLFNDGILRCREDDLEKF